MNIISITFNKINAEKKGIPKGKISVNNNVRIESMEETKIGLDKTKTTIRLSFSFDTKYSPDFADMSIQGEALILDDAKTAKALLDKWKKNKEVDKAIALSVMNNIMAKCSLEAILMARELGLPSPIPLPRIKEAEQKPAKA